MYIYIHIYINKLKHGELFYECFIFSICDMIIGNEDILLVQNTIRYYATFLI